MARHVQTFTGNGSQILCVATKPRNADGFIATICAWGTFGAGTLALELSPDGGATWMPAYNLSGTAITMTAMTNFNITLGSGGNNTDSIQLRGTLTGATAPTLYLSAHTNTGQ